MCDRICGHLKPNAIRTHKQPLPWGSHSRTANSDTIQKAHLPICDTEGLCLRRLAVFARAAEPLLNAFKIFHGSYFHGASKVSDSMRLAAEGFHPQESKCPNQDSDPAIYGFIIVAWCDRGFGSPAASCRWSTGSFIPLYCDFIEGTFLVWSKVS